MDAVNAPGFRREMHEGRMERPIVKSSFLFFAALAGLVFIMLFWRLYDLGIRRGNLFFLRAQANKTYPILISAPRGIIYDRNYERMVENAPTFVIAMDASVIGSDEEFKAVLIGAASLVGKQVRDVAEANGLGEEVLAGPSLFVRSSWPPEIFIAAGELRSVILEIGSRPEDFPFIAVTEADRRDYILGSFSSHALGYVGRPNRKELAEREYLHSASIIGKAGIETQYEEYLSGSDGKKIIEIDATGEKLRERYIVKASPGRNVALEMDKGLQSFAASTLERHLRALGKKAGVVVAMDPRNGAIRALVSFPSFDPNIFAHNSSKKEIEKLVNDTRHPFFNRAISGGYPSGSTIKPLMATAALEEKIIDPDRQIFDPGFISVPNPYDASNPAIFKDWRALGWVDMRRALAMSANVYFYTVGGGYRDIKGLGIERIKKFLNAFGWGETLGIDIPGENAGLIPDPETKKTTRPKDPVWRIGDTYITSIGQGDIQITPLQLAASIAAIANGGTLWKPRLAKAVVDGERNPVKEFQPEAIRADIASPQSLAIVREGMRQAVTAGSAKSLDDLFFTSAGKTGTAQTGVYGKNHGWFVGFAPYEDPEVVVAVLVEEGTGGSTDAVPIAKEVLYYYFTAVKNSQLTPLENALR